MMVTLLLFAKITEVTEVSELTQFSGMSPVIVEPTWTPEELKALEEVMGAAAPPTLRIVCTPKPRDNLGI
jgi:hypothetical protein